MEVVVPKLLIYGPLGVICVILLFGLIALFKAKEKQSKDDEDARENLRREYQAKEREMVAKHQEEMNVMMQRHITKAENWVEKGNDLATTLNKTLESLVRNRT